MRIEIVKNEHDRYTYEVDGERVHDSWPTIQQARRAALQHQPRPHKTVKAKESTNDNVPAV